MHKLEKYQKKILHNQSPNIPEIYQLKLSYYADMYGGAKLAQPKSDPKCNSKNFVLNKNKITACGYGVLIDKSEKSKLEPVIFDRRIPYADDVVIQILYCGVCHSDWHSITGEWDRNLPLVPGHEITGKVLEVGSSVGKFSIGDRVGVGPYINSCRQCKQCRRHNEQYCDNTASMTYDSRDRTPGSIEPNAERTYGGYSNIITVNSNYVFHIPPNLPLDSASPLLCAGITTWSPLTQAGVNGTKVAVAGIGGLGHMAIKLAKNLGAEVLAVTHTPWKLKDSKRIGADHSVLVKDMKKYNETIDVLIDTIPVKHDINKYLELLNYNGLMWIVGLFDTVDLDTSLLTSDKRAVKGSIIGGTKEIEEMLKFCADHNIVSDIEIIRLKDINATYPKIVNSEVKYRFVIEM